MGIAVDATTVRTQLAPVLYTERTILKLYQPADAEECLKLLNNTQVIALMGDMGLRTIEQWDEVCGIFTLLPQYCNGWSALCIYKILLKDETKPDGEGAFVGFVSLRISATSLADFGYILLPELWGKGLATEASRQFYRYIREEMQMEKFIAFTPPNHTASMNILKKVGFVHMGQKTFPPSKPGGDESIKELFVLPEMEHGDVVLERPER
jgi:RimJ/RimL family protein N-acetyltransferase